MRGLAPTPSRGKPTYEEFYGLEQPPFSLAPDPQFLYLSDSHDEAIRLLLQSIGHNEAFIVLTGDLGTGKTTISHALMDQLDATTFTSLIVNPFFSVEELLREVLMDFGIISRDGVRTVGVASASANELTRTLQEFLSSLAPLGGKAVLILDEAQHLSTDVLERIRVIANQETDNARLLQIVLVGQPNLLEMLSRPEMRQLDQRISLRVALKPLSRPEVEAYVEHRLAVARSAVAVRFEPAAIDVVHELTSGVPRLMNLLCDRALMLGAQWSSDVITSAMVEDAARLIDLHRRPVLTPPGHASVVPRWGIVGASVLLLLGLVMAFAPLHRLIDAPLPPAPIPPTMRIAPSLQPLPVPVDIPAPPARPRPLPAF